MVVVVVVVLDAALASRSAFAASRTSCKSACKVRRQSVRSAHRNEWTTRRVERKHVEQERKQQTRRTRRQIDSCNCVTSEPRSNASSIGTNAADKRTRRQICEETTTTLAPSGSHKHTNVCHKTTSPNSGTTNLQVGSKHPIDISKTITLATRQLCEQVAAGGGRSTGQQGGRR